LAEVRKQSTEMIWVLASDTVEELAKKPSSCEGHLKLKLETKRISWK
jgi:hypothetical protein